MANRGPRRSTIGNSTLAHPGTPPKPRMTCAADAPFIRQQRALGRSWQHIAQMLGRPVPDVMAVGS
jgi:hypothetical protein